MRAGAIRFTKSSGSAIPRGALDPYERMIEVDLHLQFGVVRRQEAVARFTDIEAGRTRDAYWRRPNGQTENPQGLGEASRTAVQAGVAPIPSDRMRKSRAMPKPPSAAKRCSTRSTRSVRPTTVTPWSVRSIRNSERGNFNPPLAKRDRTGPADQHHGCGAAGMERNPAKRDGDHPSVAEASDVAEERDSGNQGQQQEETDSMNVGFDPSVRAACVSPLHSRERGACRHRAPGWAAG